MASDGCVLIRFTNFFNPFALTAYRVCLGDRRLRAASIRLITLIIKTFFIPQFQHRKGSLSSPVVYVDHALDASIPYRPKYRKIYISFTILWISCIGYLYREYGKQSKGDIFRLFRVMERGYREAGSVYDRVKTTTRRPRASRWNLPLRLMHALDPHLHCVPSLHVIVVCIAWLYLDRLSGLPGRPDLAGLRATIYRESIRITESILCLKQHSVNCVPAGLFAVSCIMEEFSAEAAYTFIDRLFTELEPDLPEREAIRAFMKEQYTGLMEAGESRIESDYRELLLKYIGDIGGIPIT